MMHHIYIIHTQKHLKGLNSRDFIKFHIFLHTGSPRIPEVYLNLSFRRSYTILTILIDILKILIYFQIMLLKKSEIYFIKIALETYF